jgi:hypothetical protein
MYVLPIYLPLTFTYTEIVSQTIGGAFLISVGQSVFTNVMLNKLTFTAPTVDKALVAATGVTELRNVFPADVIPGIVAAYMDGLKAAFAVSVAVLGCAVLVSLASRWRNLKGKDIAGGAA